MKFICETALFLNAYEPISFKFSPNWMFSRFFALQNAFFPIDTVFFPTIIFLIFLYQYYVSSLLISIFVCNTIGVL